jgi:plasmid stabilization system protein ParE
VARRVRRHADFLADVTRQLAWLARNRETSWIDRLRTDLRRVTELLDRYPAAGAFLERQRGIVLRRVILPSTPYLAWYVYDEKHPDAEVILVRLFHAQQRRPVPDPSRWLPPAEDS